MKKVVAINTVPYGSTASIMVGINGIADPKEYTFYLFTGYSYHPMRTPDNISFITIGSFFSRLTHIIFSRISGFDAIFSRHATRKLIKRIDEIKPDVIHIHNLHDWYIDIRQLFNYIKTHNIKTIWTFHDCWPFTGYCTHFLAANCYKWQRECSSCPIRKIYPKTLFFDKSKKMFTLKRKVFSNVSDLTIVTPSLWLSKLVKESFLKEYKTCVINNGIDLSLFTPTKSSFRQRFGLDDKFIILGVSFGWTYRKGVDVFIELAKKLDNRFQIVLVGTDAKIEKKLPKKVVCIRRTQNVQDLVDIYSASDILLNPTREDNFPTVNIESIACGTPVVSFDVGGSPEIYDENSGITVKKDNIDELINTIEKLYKKNLDSDLCIKRSKMFDKNELFKRYLKLY